MMINHEKYMRLALRLALKAKGRTFPNPLVGAVIVKGARIVGKGFHHKAGGPHAEILALKDAGRKARGATLYVTLEPCSHYGRTAPCVDEILKSNIKEVVIGMRDPNPLNNGRGILKLKRQGMKVKVGVIEEELKKINEPFLKYINKGIPFITVKVAQSLDGKIAAKTGDSKWITSGEARHYTHLLRHFYDGIMLGVNTVIKDNPVLKSQNSKKIIVDSHLRTPLNARLFSHTKKDQVIIATLRQNMKKKESYKEKATLLELQEKDGKVDLRDLLSKLAKMEITNILVEGGGRLIGSLFDEKLVDKVLFFIAPKIIGGEDAISSVRGRGIKDIDRVIKLKGVQLKRIGEDFLIEGDSLFPSPHRGEGRPA